MADIHVKEERSPRISKGLKRQPIFMILLKEDNKPTNARRIQSLLSEYDVHFFGRGYSRARISTGAIGSFCRDLRNKGWLESKKLRPPRYKDLSEHYYLPIDNVENILKVARYLTAKMPRKVLESDYGDFLLDVAIVPYAEVILGQELKPSSVERLKEVCACSPSALRLLLDPGINDALDRIAHEMGHYEPMFEYLIDYLDALRLTDIAEGRHIRHSR